MTRPELSRRALFGVLAFLAIAVWRILSRPPAVLWRDWLLILAGYGIYTLFARTSRTWPIVTASVMAYLFGIYMHGHLPYALSVLGLGQ